MRISVVMPVLNEAARVAGAIESLGEDVECLVVDGGSDDNTLLIARECGATIVNSVRGRARQMNAGAAHAKGDLLIFLHADTRLPPDWREQVLVATEQRTNAWGRFDVRLDSRSMLLRLVGALMNLRSRWTGICTGDQAIFVTRRAFERLGGYPDIELMEDIALSVRLRRCFGWPCCIAHPVLVSARRWQVCGAWRTIFAMWRIRYLYWRGVAPDELHRLYYGAQAQRVVR